MIIKKIDKRIIIRVAIISLIILLFGAYKILFFKIGDEYYSIYSTKVNIFTDNISEINDLYRMRNLEDIYISSNIDLKILYDFPNLKRLGFNIRFASDNWEPVSSLKNLEECSVFNATLSDASIFKDLTKLKILSFSCTPIDDISCLNKLSQLELLCLDRTDITDISVIKNMPKLKKLVIHDTRIQDLSPIFELKNLKTLNVDAGMLTNQELEKLYKMGVEVKIDYE